MKEIKIYTTLVLMLFTSISIAQVAVSKGYDWTIDESTKKIDRIARINKAVEDINMTSWGYTDSFEESYSSFINGASFWTKRFGLGPASSYLVLEMNHKEYIFKNVPLKIWKNLKSSESKGEFYNYYIKGYYQL
jgi:hypothetical protein